MARTGLAGRPGRPPFSPCSAALHRLRAGRRRAEPTTSASPHRDRQRARPPSRARGDPSRPRRPRPEPEETLPPVNHRVSLPALMRKDLGPTRIVRQRPARHRRRLHPARGHLPQRRPDRLRRAARADRQGPVPRDRAQPRLHRALDLRHRPGPGPRAGLAGPRRASSSCTPTTAATPAPTRPRRLDRETRLGYAEDAINAVRALRREPYVDADRMAMLGRSMGGGVTLDALVARPGLVDAAVVYASVSSRFLDNLDHFTVPNRPGGRAGAVRPVRHARRSRRASTASCRRARSSTGSPSRC